MASVRASIKVTVNRGNYQNTVLELGAESENSIDGHAELAAAASALYVALEREIAPLVAAAEASKVEDYRKRK